MSDTLYVTRGSGNSLKPTLVLRQTGRRCDVRFVDVLAGESRTPAFLAINPRGQVPYLVTADGTGIGESNAIAWYFAEGTPLMPADARSRAQAVQWMIFEQTALEPAISPARFFGFIVPDRAAEHAVQIPQWRDAARRGLAVLDAHLASRDFVTDHGYSVADIAVYGYTHLAGEAGVDLTPYAAVGRWIDRIQATPGYAGVDELLVP